MGVGGQGGGDGRVDGGERGQGGPLDAWCRCVGVVALTDVSGLKGRLRMDACDGAESDGVAFVSVSFESLAKGLCDDVHRCCCFLGGKERSLCDAGVLPKVRVQTSKVGGVVDVAMMPVGTSNARWAYLASGNEGTSNPGAIRLTRGREARRLEERSGPVWWYGYWCRARGAYRVLVLLQHSSPCAHSKVQKESRPRYLAERGAGHGKKMCTLY